MNRFRPLISVLRPPSSVFRLPSSVQRLPSNGPTGAGPAQNILSVRLRRHRRFEWRVMIVNPGCGGSPPRLAVPPPQSFPKLRMAPQSGHVH
ncbi:MAG: hypothetical protein ABSH17_11675 [Syntrophobacteraceae bacterium]